MTHDADSSAVKPTVIDLDPDDVTVDRDESTPPRSDGAPPAPPPRRTTSYGSVAFIAALALGAVGGGWLYRDVLSTYFPDDHVKALADRVDVLGKGHEAVAGQVQALDRLTAQLTEDVNTLESAAGTAATETKALADGLAATKSGVASLKAALDETKAALAGMANSPPPAATGGPVPDAVIPADVAQRLAALEQDVAALKAQKSGVPDTAALTQTMADLKAKIEAGTAFPDESDRIARLLPAAGGLDVLAAHAANGLPTAKGLATELAALKPSLPTPEIKIVPEESGIWDRIGEALSSVITIRDLDAVNWQVVAEKAIAFAEAGDLPQAIAAIDEPEGALPAGLQQWRDRAAARVALEAALASVSSAAARVQSAGQ